MRLLIIRQLKSGSRAKRPIDGQDNIERHRHRYEFNNDFREVGKGGTSSVDYLLMADY
jgi:CTP synthase (UTP-ammonia lyase)